jgi:hypothetical protein
MRNIVKIAVVAALVPTISWADATRNTCKPDLNNPDNLNIVTCTWGLDTSVTPLPDVTNCQGQIRVPNSSQDDCGNSDFSSCMQNIGFTCSIITNSSNYYDGNNGGGNN